MVCCISPWQPAGRAGSANLQPHSLAGKSKTIGATAETESVLLLSENIANRSESPLEFKATVFKVFWESQL
ncbi:Hypothetical predicted protein, partial [Paramuricea clavata]